MSDRWLSLWQQYSRRLGTFIRNRVRDDAEAEDILQEVFIRVHLHVFIFRVVIGACVEAFRFFGGQAFQGQVRAMFVDLLRR